MRQIQIFYGRYHPRTGNLRQLAVVWEEGRVIESGPPSEVLDNNPGVPVRELAVWIDLSLMRNFNPPIGNPLQA